MNDIRELSKMKQIKRTAESRREILLRLSLNIKTGFVNTMEHIFKNHPKLINVIDQLPSIRKYDFWLDIRYLPASVVFKAALNDYCNPSDAVAYKIGLKDLTIYGHRLPCCRN